MENARVSAVPVTDAMNTTHKKMKTGNDVINAEENLVAGVVVNGKRIRKESNGSDLGDEELGELWRFKSNEKMMRVNGTSIRGVLDMVKSHIPAVRDNGEGVIKEVIPLGHGDPAAFECFKTAAVAEEAVAETLRSGKFNCYPPSIGLPSARRAIAEYLSQDLPYQLTTEDVFLTAGCTQAIEVLLHVLEFPGANILLPRPGFPLYESISELCDLEVRHFDLLPDNNWEVDLDAVESLADDNTIAMVVINPGNPCGNVFPREHLAKIANVARKLGVLVIADEVYGHLTFGRNPFVPMGEFGTTVPVITIGSLSKRWAVPGWRVGWIGICDPNHILRKKKVVDGLKNYLNVCSDPATFVQAAVPKIIQGTTEEFFNSTKEMLRQTAEMCYNTILNIDCISCPHKPEGSMFVMVKLDVSRLENIQDDFDFCCKLAQEESVVVLPGKALGMKGWLRITFAADQSILEKGLARLHSFCKKHLIKAT